MKRIVFTFLVITGVIFLLQVMPQNSGIALLQSQPNIEFLGEGGSYTIGAGRHFIVKRTSPFVFFSESGPTYNAAPGERVWAATLSAPAAVRPGTWIDYGAVPENCTFSYTAIDDDADDRINTFHLDGRAIHEMPQGMVTGGQFTTEKAGNLRLLARDSIGIWVNDCQVEDATPTPTMSSTPRSSPTSTVTPGSPSTPAAPEVTTTPTQSPPTPTPTATKKPRLPACLRINFEVSGGEALEGIYEVREVGGRLLYAWYAQAGWRDSGWIYGIDISFENVYIEVFYVSGDGSPLKMVIANPVPGTPYGWLSRGTCHALEIGWPDLTITPTPTPDAADGFNDEFDQEQLDLQRYIWPDIQPTPSSTPSSSLRG